MIGKAIQMPENHTRRRHALLSQKIQYCVRPATQLVMDPDRRPGLQMRLRRSSQHVRRMFVEHVESPGDLDHPGLDPGRADPAGQLVDEQLRQSRPNPLHHLDGVMLSPMKPRRRDNMYAGLFAHLRQPLSPTPQPVRRPLHNRPATRLLEVLGLLHSSVRIIQLLPCQQRTPEEQMIVRIGDPELARRHVTQNSSHLHEPIVLPTEARRSLALIFPCWIGISTCPQVSRRLVSGSDSGL